MQNIDDWMDDYDFGFRSGLSLRPDAIRQRRWRMNNPERNRLRCLIDQNNKRARSFGASGRITVDQWLAVLAEFGELCLRCGSSEDLQIDHIKPLSKGGSNTVRNIQPLCKFCNKLKNSQTIDYRKQAIAS